MKSKRITFCYNSLWQTKLEENEKLFYVYFICCGQQIALATRDKVVTPPIFYPPVLIHNRPGSASLNSSLRNRFSSRNYYNFGSKKRPLSADSRFINNNLKENHRVKFDQVNAFQNFSLGFSD